MLTQQRCESGRRSSGGPTRLEQGFTLVELLIVIVILGILAGIVVFAVGGMTTNSKATGCKAEKRVLNEALESYKANVGTYPTAVAAGGGSHHAIDLLDGAAATTPSFGTLLKAVAADYTIDDAGAGTISLTTANPGGCT